MTKEFENLTKLITYYPNGISIQELSSLETTPRRTLQYQLSQLVQRGLLRIEGLGRSTKYVIAEKPTSYSVIPLSPEGLNIQKLISAPIQLRKHVSYQRKFIESYTPNKTFYLRENDLEKLMTIGFTYNKHRPAGTFARKIYQRLLIDLSWNSSRLEGNTYSLLETEKLLETGEEAFGKDPQDAQMILNHKEAIEFMVDMAEEITVNSHTILNIHSLLSNNLLTDPKACGGLRKIPVKIGKSVYHPLEVPQLIEEYFHLIIQKGAAIKNPFEQSFFLMVHLPYLQPFLDVNKRVSRLAGNIPFIRENLSPLSFIDVPKDDYIHGLLSIYELNRIELFRDVFIWAYERSASLYSATLGVLGEPDPFRMVYRDPLRQVILEVVKGKMNKHKASQHIAKFAQKKISEGDRKQFIEVVEIEVSSLHEGNFARFKIRHLEFLEWQKGWK